MNSLRGERDDNGKKEAGIKKPDQRGRVISPVGFRGGFTQHTGGRVLDLKIGENHHFETLLLSIVLRRGVFVILFTKTIVPGADVLPATCFETVPAIKLTWDSSEKIFKF